MSKSTLIRCDGIDCDLVQQTFSGDTNPPAITHSEFIFGGHSLGGGDFCTNCTKKILTSLISQIPKPKTGLINFAGPDA